MASSSPSRGLNIGLWVVQVLLGLFFLAGGAFKTFGDLEAAAAEAKWIETTGYAVARFAGVVEILGGLGLILPAATRILPVLTPLAGIGLSLVMVTALGIHVYIGGDDFMFLPLNIALGGLALFVAWGRGTKAPITAR